MLPLLAGLLWADDSHLALRVWTFVLPGTELGAATADFNGDGKPDLVVAHLKGKGAERELSIYFQGPRLKRFTSDKPQRRWAVPADACAFAVGDFDPQAGGEALFLCPTRVVLIRGAGETITAFKGEGFFDRREEAALPLWDLVQDLDGDGLPEVLVPTKSGYTVLGRSAKTSLKSRGTLEVPIDQSFGPAFEGKLLNRFLSTRLRLRRVVAIDLNGDKRLDLAAYRAEGLAHFLQRKDGTFPSKPDREEELALVKKAESKGGKKEGEKGGEAFANVRLTLDDLDGDGAADLLVTETQGSAGVFSSLSARLVIFRGRAGKARLWNERKPEVVIRLKGLASDPLRVDWDGDGKRDLILSSYRMDMFTNLKRAVFKTLKIEYRVFLQQAKGPLFKRESDVNLEVEVPLDALGARGGHQAVILHADLNGDGLRDQIARRPEGGLRILLGKREKGFLGGTSLGFDTKHPAKLSIFAEPPRVVDLDGDGKDELIFEPFGGDDLAARTLRVVGVAK